MFGRKQKSQRDAGDPEPTARGWDAIDAACGRLYGDQVPKHVGYTPGLSLGSALQGCSAYRADGYWHYVTYGLSNLFDADEGDSAGVSGWGYELTWRIRDASSAADEAPEWPFVILHDIARWATQKPLVLDTHVRLPVGGPVTGYPRSGGPDTLLTVIAIIEDPTLGAIQIPNGRVQFLQLVGVKDDDWQAMKAADSASVLEGLRVENPMLITSVG